MKISIIIPVYNRAKSVIRTINSVLNQSYSDFEILVIDDGSTDGIDDAMLQFDDERVIYLKLWENKGVSAARNCGLEACSGDAICFLDSDDVFGQDYLSKMATKMKLNSAQVVACLARYTGDQVRPTELQHAKYQASIKKFSFLLRGNIFPLPCLLFSSELKVRLVFNETYKSYEDYAMLLGLHAEKIFDSYAFLPEVLVEVNDSVDGINKNYKNILTTLNDIEIYYNQMIMEDDVNAYNFARNVVGIEKRTGRNILRSRHLLTIIRYHFSLRNFLALLRADSRY